MLIVTTIKAHSKISSSHLSFMMLKLKEFQLHSTSISTDCTCSSSQFHLSPLRWFAFENGSIRDEDFRGLWEAKMENYCSVNTHSAEWYGKKLFILSSSTWFYIVTRTLRRDVKHRGFHVCCFDVWNRKRIKSLKRFAFLRN